MKSLFVLFFTFIATLIIAQDVEWTAYGRDPGGQRFVPIDQIQADNVDQLELAWTFRTGEYDRYKQEEYLVERAAFEATPLVINRVMYFPTPSNQLFALDATNGKKLWHYDPGIDLMHSEFSELTCRGVSYWSGQDRERILMGTVDGRICSVDARNGKADANFGEEGCIDLKLGVGLVQVTSAPAIYNNIVIVGTSIGDNNRTHDSRGVVRAFRITDGKELWRFDPIPTHPQDAAFGQWENGSAYRTGAANVWATISVDTERDLVFLPTSSPSPDFYGGERLGNNDYANSVVALQASTGAYRWHFQVVHHDIWDYDIPAQPLLFDFSSAQQEKIPAVAIGTKMGHIFVLNRLTGEALLPYEERPVPQSDIPGERTSPTQPFPILPAPLGLQELSPDDAWGRNEAEKAKARKDFASHRYEGIFTPPSFEGTIVAPGNSGGINWGGMSYDPQQNLLITNINNMAHLIQLHARHQPAKYDRYLQEVSKDDNQIDPETNRMLGTPYRMSRLPYIQFDSTGLKALIKPPWGTILAIDLSNGEKKWEVPLGYMADTPEYRQFGSINKGGSCLTSGGLTFVAATLDNHLRAFDTATGQLLWQRLLPASGIATPMSYSVDGRQYLAIAAGGHGKNPFTKKGDYIVVFSLQP